MFKPRELKEKLSIKHRHTHNNSHYPLIIREFEGQEAKSNLRYIFINCAKNYIHSGIKFLKEKIRDKQKHSLSIEVEKKNLRKLETLDKQLENWFFEEPKGFKLLDNKELENPRKLWTEELQRVIALVVFYVYGNKKRVQGLKKLELYRSQHKMGHERDILVHTVPFPENPARKMILLEVPSHALRDNLTDLNACLEMGIAIEGNHKIQRFLFSGLEHAPLSNENVGEESIRYYMAIKSIRAILKLELKKWLTSAKNLKHSKQGVIDLPVSVLSLLRTSIADVPVQKKRQQVMESRDAYRALDNQVIDIEVNRKSYKVRPKFIYMNMGEDILQGLNSRRLQDRINHRGLNVFCDKFIGALKKKHKKCQDKKVELLIKRIINIETDSNLHKKKVLLRGAKIRNGKSINDSHRRLEQLGKKISREEDIIHVASDRVWLRKIRKHALQKAKLVKEWCRLKRHSRKHEFYLDKLNEKIYSRRRKRYQSELTDLKEEVFKLINLNTMGLAQKQLLNQVQLYLEALEAYYDQERCRYGKFEKKFVKPLVDKLTRWSSASLSNDASLLQHISAVITDGIRVPYFLLGTIVSLLFSFKTLSQWSNRFKQIAKQNYDFQTRFLILQESLGSFVHWFCEEEKRTMNLQDEYLQAFYLFYENYHRFPSLNKKDECQVQEYVEFIRHYSPPKWREQKIAVSSSGTTYLEDGMLSEASVAKGYEQVQRLQENHILTVALRRVCRGMRKVGKQKRKVLQELSPKKRRTYTSLVHALLQRAPGEQRVRLLEKETNIKLVVKRLRKKVHKIKSAFKKVI